MDSADTRSRSAIPNARVGYQHDNHVPDDCCGRYGAGGKMWVDASGMVMMSKLTMREQEILVELARGFENREEIAKRLDISTHTVNSHMTSMFEKTGCRSQTQLVLWGFREALEAARPVLLKIAWPAICSCGKARVYRAGLCIGCFSIEIVQKVTQAQETTTMSLAKHEEIYNYIVMYKCQNDGNSPSMRQIALRCGLASTSQVDYYLNMLEVQNKIRRTDKGDGVDNRRQIAVVGGQWRIKAA